MTVGVRMRILSVEIQKFWSIKYAKFFMKDITAVVGENNAVKTAIIIVINSVINYLYEHESFGTKKHQYVSQNNTYINLMFDDVPSKECYTDKMYGGN